MYGPTIYHHFEQNFHWHARKTNKKKDKQLIENEFQKP